MEPLWSPVVATGGNGSPIGQARLLDRIVEFTWRADACRLATVLHEDVRFTMPPQPGVWQGRDRVLQSWIDGGFGSDTFGSLRCLTTRANRQPAVANYVKRPEDPAHLPLALDVLRIQEGTLIAIITFGPEVFPAFDLPQSCKRGTAHDAASSPGGTSVSPRAARRRATRPGRRSGVRAAARHGRRPFRGGRASGSGRQPHHGPDEVETCSVRAQSERA